MATLLFECFSEEMPARMQDGAREQLQRLLTKAFTAGNIEHGAIQTFSSPRHLAIRVENMLTIQPDILLEKKGPKVGAPQAAIDGFLKSAGVTLEQCEQRPLGKDIFYYTSTLVAGRKMTDWLKDTLEQVMSEFVWPKSMRWGSHTIQWVRPLHAMTCLLDSEIIPVKFGHITASNITYGHRFLAPAAITLKHANDYVSELKQAHVMVDVEARKQEVHKEAVSAAKAQGLTLVEDIGLLSEVTGLIEWPRCYVGTFEESFMAVPREVLTSEMRHHQKYFSLQKTDGSLSNHFIITANMICTDGGTAIKSGNARVLRARLADGEFYWNQDRNTALDVWAEKLRDVVFHAKVGMMNEKVERIVSLSQVIAKEIGANEADVSRAAQLCKADLVTGMVGEFPELQGIMGRYYALQQGESQAVADAIRDHYKPLGASDDVPTDPITICVALADKIDSIVSLFAAGEKPTGSKDPLALRRAALGVLKIILDNNLHIDLFYFVTSISKSYSQTKEQPNTPYKHQDKIEAYHALVFKEAEGFFADRLRVILRDEGLRHDIIEASIAASTDGFLPTEIAKKSRDLTAWLACESGAAAFAAIKRALNILAAEEKKNKSTIKAEIIPFSDAQSTVPEQYELLGVVQRASNDPNVTPSPSREFIDNPLSYFEKMTLPINAFLDTTRVDEEGKKEERLALLARVRQITHTHADFSLIEG